ncbi:hypothetical protein FB567DRAFT_618786 [Paraphoma chrysanthemicola]|uniref:Rhodopsin domain-containing protein n=1 Tax=Paraphoma chrysanthemicola TaxID=798071 RepID=A0A8K0RB74_9PLEO|nr:hypothetical protein FB567DRAFT_618786 [Paraphoma chrysanthemicola]
MSSLTNGFAQGTVLKVAYSMLGLTSAVILARIGLNILRPKSLIASDYFVFLAFAFYATMCALYISVSPYMHRVYGVLNEEIPPYPEMAEDTIIMTKMIFAAPCMFWLTLWSIKVSLLLLYRRLLIGLERRYTIIWWGILAICVVTFAGNYIMYFRSCGTIPGFWTGGCSGNPAKNAQLASLYYSFTVDTTTNLMIMALPIKLTWSLQMPRSKKIAILLLFASGFVCILFACLRVAQVAINAAKPEADGQPLDPTWLAIWGMVECSIAVIIGTCPAFAILINAFRTKSTYDSRGYRKQTDSKSGGGEVALQTIGSMSTRERNQKLGLQSSDSHWADVHSSREDLRAEDADEDRGLGAEYGRGRGHEGIMVRTTVVQKEASVGVHAI